MVQDLLQPGNPVEVTACSSARCDEFAIHFEGKITQIRSELDSTVTAKLEDVSSVPCLGQILMDEFQLLRPEDVDRVLGSICSTTTLLDPCPSWLIGKSAGQFTPNASLREGVVPTTLKEAVIWPLLKKPNLDPRLVVNYRPCLLYTSPSPRD